MFLFTILKMATCVAETRWWLLCHKITYLKPSVFNLFHACNQCTEHEAYQIKFFFDAMHPFQLVSFFSKPQSPNLFTQDRKACICYIQFSTELLLKVTIPVQYRNWKYLQHAIQKFIVITNSTIFLQNNFVPSKLNSTYPLAPLWEECTTVIW